MRPKGVANLARGDARAGCGVVAREMGGTGTAHAGGGARAEIRKRQNRDSARRSREKRKSHLRGVAESVELQSRRVRELDARVAQLEALVHRAVRPRTARPAAASASTGSSAAGASSSASPAVATPAGAFSASSPASRTLSAGTSGARAAVSASFTCAPAPVNPGAPSVVVSKRSPVAHPQPSPASAPVQPLRPPGLVLRPPLPASAPPLQLNSRSPQASLQVQPQPLRKHAQLHTHSLPLSDAQPLPSLPTHDAAMPEPVPFAPSPPPANTLVMAMAAVGSIWNLGEGGLDSLADASNGIDTFMTDDFGRKLL